jgi:hypothetical protein
MLAPIPSPPLLCRLLPERIGGSPSPVLCQLFKVSLTIAFAFSRMSDKPSDFALVSVGFDITHVASLFDAGVQCC